MSCVVALKHGGSIFMGADSAYSTTNSVCKLQGNQKVVIVGSVIMGFTGEMTLAFLRHFADPPAHQQGISDSEYLALTFLPALENYLKGTVADYWRLRSATENAIIGYNNVIYSISTDWHPCSLSETYWAVGSGAEYALGALHAAPHLDPESRVRTALAAAGEFCPTVAPPYYVLELKPRSEDA